MLLFYPSILTETTKFSHVSDVAINELMAGPVVLMWNQLLLIGGYYHIYAKSSR
jgi:hypothetical protein